MPTIHFSCFSKPFFLLLAVLSLCIPLQASAAKNTGENPEPVIIAKVNPLARLTIYKKIAILPVLVDGKETHPLLTNTLYQSLLELQKYRIAPLEPAGTWFANNFPPDDTFSRANLAQQAGTALQTNAVLVSEVHHKIHSGELIIGHEKSPPVTSCTFTLFDTKNGTIIWNLTISREDPEPGSAQSLEHITATMQQAMTALRREMVQQGDIFSPQLPRPEVLSSQGGIRSVRIVLQPDPPHIFSRYQLLRAENADATFSAVGIPTTNEAPVILADTDLADATSYYYTVIGLTKDGFANIPAPPFKIETTGPPAPVSNLRAGGASLRHIQLFWDPSQDPTVDGYLIFRSLQAEGDFEQIAEINGREKQTYIDKGQASGFSRYGDLADNTDYYYTIRTRNVVGTESSDSPIIKATTKGAPEPPTNIQAIDRQPKKLPLAWTAATNPEITGYAIYRATSPDGPFEQIDYVNGREKQQYVDDGNWDFPLTNDTTYWYRIRSVNVVEVQSVDSTTVSATTKAAPKAVTGVTAQSGQFRRITLNWQPGVEPDIQAYEVFRGGVENNITTKVRSIQPELTAYTDTSLADSRTYWYQIRAIDKDDLAGERSEIIQATTKHPPRQPTGVRGTVIKDEIRLSWQPNPEQDIDHYEISTTGFLAGPIGESEAPHYAFPQEEKSGAELYFQVRAVDKDGLKSEYSESVLVIIP